MFLIPQFSNDPITTKVYSDKISVPAKIFLKGVRRIKTGASNRAKYNEDTGAVMHKTGPPGRFQINTMRKETITVLQIGPVTKLH